MTKDLEPMADLGTISTQWSQLGDANVFVLRYTNAIETYLKRLLKDENDTRDVLQSFLLRVLERGFERVSPDLGRFRYYLIRSVHNAAITHLRTTKRRRVVDIEELPESLASSSDELRQYWQRDWHDCILGRAWQRLEEREQASESNLYFTVLQISSKHPELDSKALAATVTECVGRPVSAELFRQQLSRSRKAFARLIVEEVAETLETPSRSALIEELTEVGLLTYVQEFLPSETSD
ncbi:MAG: sigma factor [Planctomycetota bacterium]